MASKNDPKNKRAKPSRSTAEISPGGPAETIAELRRQLAEAANEAQECRRQLAEALENQAATSEVLGIISRSRTDVQPVLDAIVQSAARVCGIDDVSLRLVEGTAMVPRAHFGSIAVGRDNTIDAPHWRWMREHGTHHVPDVSAQKDFFIGYGGHWCTYLGVPLRQQGEFIGALFARRTEVRPFTPAQIKLLETFADQAVIAIENVRLFKELQERNAELREALEHQTATSEVLGIISRSPTDVQPVLDAIVESAAKVCGIDDVVLRLRHADANVVRAHFGSVPMTAGREAISINESHYSWVHEHGTLHIPDVHAQRDVFPTIAASAGARARTFLIAPLRQQGEFLGTLNARRMEVRPFTPAQIKLLETFADQAVIAIENVRLFNELRESLEQQTATSEILGVIASSPTDIQPVLDIIAENASRICGTPDVAIVRAENETYRFVATYGSAPTRTTGTIRPLDRGSVTGRAIIDRKTMHIHDVRTVQDDFWHVRNGAVQEGLRTMLAIPLLREGLAMGAIGIRRTEVQPFTDKQIALLKTFADQAVIAIENVRLFKEIQERNAELREALEHQTATSEVLGIISRSPTDVQPVLDAIVESAAKVCGIDDVLLRLHEGKKAVPRAHFGPIPIGRMEPSIDEPRFQWMREHGTLHVSDVRERNELQIGRTGRWRTLLAVPLRQQGEFIGSLNARRMEVRPFTAAQIKLLETFADQAVIALENVRLFQELKESLEQQTATSEILGVIASSPTDVQPVLDVVVEHAAKLCEATDARIYRVDGDLLRSAAQYGTMDWTQTLPLHRGVPSGRAVLDRKSIHLHDMLLEVESEYPNLKENQKRTNTRTLLVMPLSRESLAIGAIVIRRTEVRPFSEKQIALLQTFADQAVIAIENVRLFRELQDRNAELREALEHQTATAEVLGIISRSPTDVQPVLDAIVESAARVCSVDDVILRLREENSFISRAHFGSIPIPVNRVEVSTDAPQFRWIREHGTLHVPDVRAQNDFPMPGSFSGSRLIVPLRQQGEFIGTLIARHIEVRPFSPAQIKLLETFGDQAVIALENVRLFNELRESLEQQTATSEILGVIASSPTDIQPVLDSIAQSAARVCGSEDATIRLLDGDEYFLAAHFGTIPPPLAKRGSLQARSVGNEALLQGKTIQIADLQAETERYPDSSHMGRGIRTFLVTPLLREGTAIGLISIRRTEVKPFSDKQVALLETFASQAVIAIENVRLFKELQARNRDLGEALDQQTATSEVLKVISRSTFDLQPVLETLIENATQLCGANSGAILRRQDGLFRLAVAYNVAPEWKDFVERNPIQPGRGTTTGRVALEHRVVHIPDTLADPEYFHEAQRLGGQRTVLGVPMMRESNLIGVIIIRKLEVVE